MKKLQMLALVLLMAGTMSLQAQTTLGGRIGANIGFASVDGLANIISPDISPLTTFTGGITLNHRIDERLSVTTGAHYKRKGFVASESIGLEVLDIEFPIDITGNLTTRLDYIEVPLLLNIALGSSSKVQPYVEFGPAFSYAVSGTAQPSVTAILEFNLKEQDLDLTKDRYNRFEVSGQAVAGLKIPYGSGIFDLGVSYTHAITDSIDDTVVDIEFRNYGIGIHAGWAMPIGAKDQ